jgi:broad specificity phosphatase PhoE
VRRLVLIRHAPTAATRAFAFPADEELDERGREAASGLRVSLPSQREVLSSPARRCLATVAAAALGDATVDPLIAECDFGSWRGSTLDGLPEDDVAAWMTDPDAAPHGGESQRAFVGRVAGWLDAQAGLDGSAVAITHGGVVKACVEHALGAPIEAFWRVDAAPLAVTEMHAHDGRWTVTKVNAA